MSVDQIDQADQDLESAWTGWTPRHSALRQRLSARRQELTTGNASE
jgi:hypothetical protein